MSTELPPAILWSRRAAAVAVCAPGSRVWLCGLHRQVLLSGARHTALGLSLTLWPFALKAVMAPFVDIFWSPRLGRRKSWVVPYPAKRLLLWLFDVRGSQPRTCSPSAWGSACSSSYFPHRTPPSTRGRSSCYRWRSSRQLPDHWHSAGNHRPSLLLRSPRRDSTEAVINGAYRWLFCILTALAHVGGSAASLLVAEEAATTSRRPPCRGAERCAASRRAGGACSRWCAFGSASPWWLTRAPPSCT